MWRDDGRTGVCVAVLVVSCVVALGRAHAQPIVVGTDKFPVPGGQYESINTTGYKGLADAELRSMVFTLPCQPPNLVALPSDPGGGSQVESFFDVFTELTMDGGQSWFVPARPSTTTRRPGSTRSRPPTTPPTPAAVAAHGDDDDGGRA